MDELYEATDYLREAVFRAGDCYKARIVIAGNHDFVFREHPLEAHSLLHDFGFTYLQDAQLWVDGFKFYGSPWSPTFMQWAFMKERGPEIRKVWDAIPRDTNILLTHTPPRFILDQTVIWGDMAGCQDLRDVVLTELPDLQLHVFGHIHEGYGQTMEPYFPKEQSIHFVNASRVNEAYSPINEPVVVELSHPKRSNDAVSH